MARFNSFIDGALNDQRIRSEVRMPFNGQTLDEAMRDIASFVNGALSELVLGSYIFVGPNAISVTGWNSEERLVLHPGFFYYEDDTTDGVDRLQSVQIMPREEIVRYAQLGTNVPVMGVLLQLTATDRTQGYAKIRFECDGVVAYREVQVAADDPVIVAIFCRTHDTGESKTYAVSGDGSSGTPYQIATNVDVAPNQTKALFKARQIDPLGAVNLSIEYQLVQVEVEVLPQTFPYLRRYFGNRED
jgi:hypothetical protein